MKFTPFVLLVVALTPLTTHADIVQPDGNSFSSFLSFFAPAQTFTADSTVTNLGSIGIVVGDVNTSLANGPMTMELYEGVGFGGPLLRSVTKVISMTSDNNFDCIVFTCFFTDFDFTGITLTPGQIYSFLVIPSLKNNRGGFVHSDSDLYPGGVRLNSFTGEIFIGRDVAFRVRHVIVDTDNDTIPDDVDNCPTDSNPDQADFDGDGLGDVCDPDDDNDGVSDDQDLCPETPAGEAVDLNGCSVDSDGDGVPDGQDLCLGTPSGEAVDLNGCSDSQVDSDGDGFCDPDAPSSGPSVCSGTDNCPDSDRSATIVIDGIDTGVENELLADGCTLADLIDTLVTDDPTSVDVVQFLVDLKAEGFISGQDLGAILKALNSP